MTIAGTTAAPIDTHAPQSPLQFAEAALQIIVKGLSDDSVDTATIQADLAALVTSYTSCTPSLVLKAVKSRRMIYGWASVVTKDNAAVTDLQGDVLNIDNLREVVHKFMDDRAGDTMHDREQAGEIVDSFVMDDEVSKAFGVNFGREGWMVGWQAYTTPAGDAVWKRIESGELQAFSFDADGVRSEMEN